MLYHFASLAIDGDNKVPTNACEPLLTICHSSDSRESVEYSLTRNEDLTIGGDRERTFKSRFVRSCSK